MSSILHNKLQTLFVFLAVLALSGCGVFSDSQPRLEGERISILELEKSLEPSQTLSEDDIAGMKLPDSWTNHFWPQAGGYPNHAMQNLALRAEPLSRIWSTSIGSGTTEELPLTTQPVLVDDVLYTVDTQGMLQATYAEDGERLWRQSLIKPGEDEPVIGGGLAYAHDILYATNGFNELLAIAPDSGEILWRKELPAPSRAAPTVINGRIFVTTLNNRLLVFDADSSALLWEHVALDEAAGVVGAASPAANQDIIVPVFSSGEIIALRVENGSVAWSDNLSSVRKFSSLASISDIKAMPVIDNGAIYAMSFSGKLVAIDEHTGARLWQQNISGTNTPWVAGDMIFALSSDKQLVALNRMHGKILWVVDLPALDGDDDPARYIGPVMAGGNLLVFSTDGAALAFEPTTGDILYDWAVRGDLAIAPIVVKETLYTLNENGTLSAWR